MSERTFVRAVHWIVQIDELGIGDPGINNLDLRDGRVARVNGAGIEYWAGEVSSNSVEAEEIAFDAVLGDGRRAQIRGSIASQNFELRFEQGGRRSCFVALAHVSRRLARNLMA